MKRADVTIVGAGHAGAQAALLLRQQGFTGSVALISDEPEFPYERPPLSKDYLSGEKPFDRILIRPPAFWEERDIRLLLATWVTAIDPANKNLIFGDGQTFDYGVLIWSTGGAPRRLSCDGADLAGVHAVRTRSDVDLMMRELVSARNVVVIGGGYIGLEAAAVLTKLGKPVTVLEALDRVLARVAGEPLSRFYEAEHRAHGVDLQTGVGVTSLEGEGGRVAAVHLANGDRIPCDLAIVGIGILPAVRPLLDAGAAGGNGVDVDAYCQTSLADVYAIGDCAAHENEFAAGCRIRLESVQNANDQAATAVKAILGDPQPYRATPWFWSNQYDLRLQTVGLSIGHDEVVVRGDVATRSFSLIYLRRGKVIALDCVNATRDYVQGRALVTGSVTVTANELADAGISLKDLTAA